MAMELPVIITNHSGPTAYATDSNAYLIPVLPYLDDLSYAQPDPEALVVLLKQVVLDSMPSKAGTEEEPVALRKGKKARKTMEEISSESSAAMMAVRLRALANQRGWVM